MAAAAVPLMVGGSLLSAFGSMQEGEANGQAHDFNAQMAEENSALSKQQAAEEERRVRIQGKKAIGDERAGYGASGVTGGSALDVLAESASNAELDALTVRRNGEIKSYQYDQQAQMERRSAGYSRSAGKIGAAAAILTGGSKIAAR